MSGWKICSLWRLDIFTNTIYITNLHSSTEIWNQPHDLLRDCFYELNPHRAIASEPECIQCARIKFECTGAEKANGDNRNAHQCWIQAINFQNLRRNYHHNNEGRCCYNLPQQTRDRIFFRTFWVKKRIRKAGKDACYCREANNTNDTTENLSWYDDR